MRGRVTVSTVLLVVLLAVMPASVGAEGPVVVNGGGTGTVDGATPFSQFGLGLSIQPAGAVRGHFECLMAGRSAVPGLHLMSVGGQVTSATVLGDVATLDGVGTLNMGDQGKVRGQRFRVILKAGGPREGMLQLTLIEPVAMVLPPETVLTGRLEIH